MKDLGRHTNQILGAIGMIVIIAALAVSVYLQYKENSFWWNR